MASNKQQKTTAKSRKTKQPLPPPPKPVEAFLNVSGKTILLKAKCLAIWSRGIVRRYRLAARGLGSFVIAAPPYFVGQYYQVDKFAAEVKSDWPVIGAMLDHHVFVGVLLAGIWAFLVLALYRVLTALAQEQPSGWGDAPSILLRALDNIVGAKEQRFSNHLKALRASSSPAVPASVFSFITQPGQQLNELILGIYSTVDSLLRAQETSKYVLKVNLAVIDQNQNIKDIHFHYPSNHPVRSSLLALNSTNSAIKTAVRTQKIVVLESIHVESARTKPRFVVTDQSRAEEDGSLICYPVIYEPMGAVVFVISIHIDQPGTFKQRFVGSYVELLKPFALRIKLEYALLALKELTVNEQTH